MMAAYNPAPALFVKINFAQGYRLQRNCFGCCSIKQVDLHIQQVQVQQVQVQQFVGSAIIAQAAAA